MQCISLFMSAIHILRLNMNIIILFLFITFAKTISTFSAFRLTSRYEDTWYEYYISEIHKNHIWRCSNFEFICRVFKIKSNTESTLSKHDVLVSKDNTEETTTTPAPTTLINSLAVEVTAANQNNGQANSEIFSGATYLWIILALGVVAGALLYIARLSKLHGLGQIVTDIVQYKNLEEDLPSNPNTPTLERKEPPKNIYINPSYNQTNIVKAPIETFAKPSPNEMSNGKAKEIAYITLDFGPAQDNNTGHNFLGIDKPSKYKVARAKENEPKYAEIQKVSDINKF